MNQQRVNPNIPLPQGWEAKLDPNANRYFFVNHIEKRTTWQDPRLDPAYQQQYAQQFTHQHPYAPAQPQSWTAPYQPSPARTQPMPTQQAAQDHSAQAAATAAATTPSKPMCGTCHEKEVPRPGDQCWKCLARDMVGTELDDEDEEPFVFSPTAVDQSEPSVRPGVNKGLYKKLRKEYPDVDPEVMQNILFTSSNLEAKAQTKLSAMGYERRRTISFSDEVPSGAAKPLEQRSSHGGYPQSALRQSQLTQPVGRPSETVSHGQPVVTQPVTQPAVKKLSDAEKERVKSKLEQEFGSTTTKEIISMAAESCDFDEEKSRILLKSMNEIIPKRAGRSTTTSSAASSVTTHSSRTSRDPWTSRTTTSSLSTDTSESRPAEASVTVPSSETVGVSATLIASSSGSPRRSASPAAVHSGVKQATAVAQPKSPKSAKTQKPTVKKTEAKPRTRYQVSPATKKQTDHQTAKKKEGYISPLRVKPKGQNPQLRKEHDPSLLLQDYLPVHGPDIRNRAGASPSNVHGPDPANCKGPQVAVKGCVIGSCVC